MKGSTLLLICLLLMNYAQAQQKAVTEKGEVVNLYDNGMWEYEDADILEEIEIPINEKVFKKGDNSTFLLKSNKMNVGFWIDPKLWSFNKGVNNPDAEYELSLKEGDLYAMIITEQIEIPLESLRAMAIEKGRMAAPNIEVVNEEYRNVNGLKVLLIQMNGTIQGIEFSYYGYYFSSHQGSVQFITYTSQNLLEVYKNECEKLLNGIVVVDD